MVEFAANSRYPDIGIKKFVQLVREVFYLYALRLIAFRSRALMTRWTAMKSAYLWFGPRGHNNPLALASSLAAFSKLWSARLFGQH